MKHFTNFDALTRQDGMTPTRTALWFKQQSDEQIAVLRENNVWYGPEHLRPAHLRPTVAMKPGSMVIVWDDGKPPPATEPRKPLISEIIAAVSRVCMVSAGEMVSPQRSQYIVRARQAVIYIAALHSGQSMPEIGRRLGNRDHSTILHSKRRVQEDLDSGGERFGDLIKHVEKELGIGDAPVNSVVCQD